jgi:hypothetical protein
MNSIKNIKTVLRLASPVLAIVPSGFFSGRELPGASMPPTGGYEDSQRDCPITDIGAAIS